jgi:hypothetical protein
MAERMSPLWRGLGEQMSNPVYLQGSMGAVFVSATGHQHIRNIPANDDIPTKINCPECEPYLVRDFYGVYSAEQVPLTDRQVAAREQATREGNAAVSEAAKALAQTATASLQQQAPARDMAEQIAAAVEAEVGRRMATNAMPAPQSLPPVQSVYRGPGRPRKEA